jgi:hypothetical protein
MIATRRGQCVIDLECGRIYVQVPAVRDSRRSRRAAKRSGHIA